MILVLILNVRLENCVHPGTPRRSHADPTASRR